MLVKKLHKKKKTFFLWNCMKMYIKHFFNKMELYDKLFSHKMELDDKHFLSTWGSTKFQSFEIYSKNSVVFRDCFLMYCSLR